MAFHKILPLHILWQEGITAEMFRGVSTGIVNVLFQAGVFHILPRYPFGQRRLLYWQAPDGSLTPHYSLDWYILQARNSSKIKGHLNSTALLNSLGNNPTLAIWPRYELVVVKEPLHWHDNSLRLVGGIGRAGQGAIITLADKLEYLNPVPGESAEDKKEREDNFFLFVLMTVMHELGHLFGLFPGISKENPTDDELKASHCQNECVMKFSVDIDFLKKIRRKPFCSDCQKNLPQYFIKP